MPDQLLLSDGSSKLLLSDGASLLLLSTTSGGSSVIGCGLMNSLALNPVSPVG